MAEILFQNSLHAYMQGRLQQAVEKVNSLDRVLFSDPALAGALEEIVKGISINIARIDEKTVSADAREEAYQASEFGRSYIAKRKVLDISIPFSGNPISFQLQPSTSVQIMHRVMVEHGSLKFTIPDDQNAENTVNAVRRQVNQNLDTLRKEFEGWKPKVKQVVEDAANTRQADIASDDERDKGRSFKVRR